MRLSMRHSSGLEDRHGTLSGSIISKPVATALVAYREVAEAQVFAIFATNDDPLIGRLYTFIFNFNFDTTPLWYLYMLIGLYIIMPIISSWLTQASRKEIKTVLYIWGVTLV